MWIGRLIYEHYTSFLIPFEGEHLTLFKDTKWTTKRTAPKVRVPKDHVKRTKLSMTILMIIDFNTGIVACERRKNNKQSR